MSTSLSYPSLSAGIAVGDGAAAIDYYVRVLGFTERFRLLDPLSGKVGHAELEHGDSLLMLADEYPQYNKTPRTLGGTSVKLSLMVSDVDSVAARAVEHGGEMLMPPTDMFYGFRSATVRDPFGHEWSLGCKVEDVSVEEMNRRWKAMSAVPESDSGGNAS
ncbi:VOC family protein [Congregicoccus parvus]|uniref:VOC family protein n=1 Tax=Congregicoccus parvus TaxID=3081749 RepID=UPI003FA5DFDB